MNQAFFFDIDGTLLDFQTHKLAKSTIEAIKTLQKKGYKVALNTSRPLETINNIPHIYDIHWDGYVCANGLCLFDENKQMIIKNNMPLATQKQIFSIAKENNIPVYSAGTREFITFNNDTVQEFIQHFDLKNIQFKPYDNEDQLLITLVDKNKELIKKAFNLPNIIINDVGDFNIDLFPSGFDKATGCLDMMKYWNLDGTYVAFGDTKADEPMIQSANIGVAMYYAMESTKKVADYICKDSIDAISICVNYLDL